MTPPRRPQSGFAPERLLGHLVGGAFKLLRVVGTGGTATVYEAQELGTSRRCAVKVLHPNPADPNAGPRFVLEGEIAQRLMGPHSVEIIRAGQMEGGQPFLVMEFLEGQDLAARLEQRGRVGPGEVVAFVLACAAVLERAHAAGVIHRDLKPANVFYAKRTTGEEIKLLDFGAAKDNARDDRLTAAGQVVGTPWYMSPEQARGQGLDARSDEFSLAIIAYQALTGRVPFDAQRPTDVLFKIVSEPMPPLKELAGDIQAAIDRVLQRALAKKAPERFSNVLAFADALKAALKPWSASTQPTIAVDLGPAPGPRVETADDELGMVLQAHNLVTAAQVSQAETMARREGGDLADALLRLGAIPELKLLSTLPMPAHWRPTPSERIRMTTPPDAALALVSVDLATRLRVLPFGWTPIKGEIRVFVAFPAVPNLEVELKRSTKAQKVAVYLTTPGAVNAAIRRWYHADPTAFTELLPSGAGPRSPLPPDAAPPAAAAMPTGSTPILSGALVEEQTPPAPPPPAAAPPAPRRPSAVFPTSPAAAAAPPPAPAGAPSSRPPVPVAVGAASPPTTLPPGRAPLAAAEVGMEWSPKPSVPAAPPRAPPPPPRPAPAAHPTTGEFDLLALEAAPAPAAAVARAPVVEPPYGGPPPTEAPAEGAAPLARPGPPTALFPLEASAFEASAPEPGEEPVPTSGALNAATAAYPVLNDVPVVPYQDLEPPPSSPLDAATSSYPQVDLTEAESEPPAPPPVGMFAATDPHLAAAAVSPPHAPPPDLLPSSPSPSPLEAAPPESGHGESLVATTGSFAIVIDEPEAQPPAAPSLAEAPPHAEVPSAAAPAVASPPQEAPPGEEFAVDVAEAGGEPMEDEEVSLDDEPEQAPLPFVTAPTLAAAAPTPVPVPEVDPAEEPAPGVPSAPVEAAPAEPPPPPAEEAAVEVALDLSQPPLSVSPPIVTPPPPPPPDPVPAPEVEPAEAAALASDEAAVDADDLEVEEDVPAEAVAGPTVEGGVEGVRVTMGSPRADVPPAPPPSPEEDEEAGSDLPVARRPTRTDVRPLSEIEPRELGLGELSRIQDAVVPALDLASVAPVAETRRLLAAPELVRQALGRVAEVARADRAALVVMGGETLADPAAVPPLFAEEWLARLFEEADAMAVLGAERIAAAGGSSWFEGATTAVALPLALGEAGHGVMVLSARERNPPFGEEDRPLLTALARQLMRVFSVAQTPARDRLDLEAWLAGERHLSSLAERDSAESVQARSREAVVLCVDARPLLSSLGDAGAVPMLERMNDLVEDISRAVYAHGGLLERVQGDGLVAVWGALADTVDEWATEALRVAEVVQRSPQARLDDSSDAGVRLGLHADRVSVGAVGLRGRRALCVVGAASAIGFRLGSLGEGFPVASEALLKRAGLLGPSGLDARVRRLESPEAGIDAYSVQPEVPR